MFSPKFYSKYCEIDMTSKDYQKFIKIIESSNEKAEMDHSSDQPVCQNQEYGRRNFVFVCTNIYELCDPVLDMDGFGGHSAN